MLQRMLPLAGSLCRKFWQDQEDIISIQPGAGGTETDYRSNPVKLAYPTQEGPLHFLNIQTNDGKAFFRFEVTVAQMDRICREYLSVRL